MFRWLTRPFARLFGRAGQRLGKLFGPRTGNLLNELPWHEIQGGVMHNRDGSFELGFEVTLPVTVFYGDHTGLLRGLKGALEDDLREGMRLRFMLESGPADRAVLEQMRSRVTATEETLQFLHEERVRLFEEDWHEGGLRGWRAYCLVRVSTKTAKFFTLPSTTVAQRKRVCDELRLKLMGSFSGAGYAAKPMGDPEVFRLVHRYLNPGRWHDDLGDYAPTWHRYAKRTVEKIPGTNPPTLRAQVAESTIDNGSKTDLLVGDHHVKMLALNKLPDRRTFASMMEGALRGGEKFFTVLDLHHQPFHKGSTVARARARRFEAAATQTDVHVDAETRHLARETSGLVDHLVETGDHLFLGSVGFVLYDRSRRRVDERVERLYSALQSVPGRPFRVLEQGLFTPFMQFAPFSGLDYTTKVTLTTSNAAHFFPVDGPYAGARKPVAFLRNRYLGVSGFDPFEGANYNGLVVGGSGSGKTFHVNWLLSEVLADKESQVVVIDRGGGYEPLVEAAQGVSISLRPGGGTRINPFDIAPGTLQPSDEERQNLLRVVRAMIPGEPGADREVEDAVLGAAVDQVYAGARRYDRERQAEVFVPPTLSDFYRRLRSIDEVGEMRASKEVKELAERLAMRLQNWTGDTPLGRFVDGQTSVPLSDARVVYYDTEGIASAGQLGVVGVMLIANLVWARIRQREGQKTLVVLDEGWTMLKGSAEARGFVEEMYRRFRRYGAGIWSVSQSYADFKNLPGITGNAEMFYSLPVGEAERTLWANELRLSERTRLRLADAHQRKGEYGEAVLMLRRAGVWEGGIVAVHPTRADYLCFSTDPADMALRSALIAEYGGLQPALAAFARGETRLPLAA